VPELCRDPIGQIPHVEVRECDHPLALQRQRRAPFLVTLPLPATGVRGMPFDLHDETIGKDEVDASNGAFIGAKGRLRVRSPQTCRPAQLQEPPLETTLATSVDHRIEDEPLGSDDDKPIDSLQIGPDERSTSQAEYTARRAMPRRANSAQLDIVGRKPIELHQPSGRSPGNDPGPIEVEP
jgi:hypothetical protein